MLSSSKHLRYNRDKSAVNENLSRPPSSATLEIGMALPYQSPRLLLMMAVFWPTLSRQCPHRRAGSEELRAHRCLYTLEKRIAVSRKRS